MQIPRASAHFSGWFFAILSILGVIAGLVLAYIGYSWPGSFLVVASAWLLGGMSLHKFTESRKGQSDEEDMS